MVHHSRPLRDQLTMDWLAMHPLLIKSFGLIRRQVTLVCGFLELRTKIPEIVVEDNIVMQAVHSTTTYM